MIAFQLTVFQEHGAGGWSEGAPAITAHVGKQGCLMSSAFCSLPAPSPQVAPFFTVLHRL